MSSEYAGADTYHATVTVVDDADPPVAASFAAGLQDVADRTAYLKGTSDTSETALARLAEVVVGYGTIKRVRGVWRETINAALTLDESGTTVYHGGPPASTYQHVARFAIPEGAVITRIVVPSMGYGYTSLPAVMPFARLYRGADGQGTIELIAEFTDPASSVAAFNLFHLNYSGAPGHMSHEVDPDYTYSLILYTGNGGTTTGVNDGLRFWPPWVEVE